MLKSRYATTIPECSLSYFVLAFKVCLKFWTLTNFWFQTVKKTLKIARNALQCLEVEILSTRFHLLSSVFACVQKRTNFFVAIENNIRILAFLAQNPKHIFLTYNFKHVHFQEVKNVL